MSRKLRHRIITKLAQTQPTTTPKTLPAVPAIPSNLQDYLNNGYNGSTVSALKQLVKLLNDAMHYASEGKDSLQDLVNNNVTKTGLPDHENVNNVATMVYNTFLNRGQDFKERVKPSDIHQWASDLLSHQAYSDLSRINPTGVMATKLQVNLKSKIQELMNSITSANPVVA